MLRGALVGGLVLGLTTGLTSPALALSTTSRMMDRLQRDYADRAHDLQGLRNALRKTLASNGHHWMTVQLEELRRRAETDRLHRPLRNGQENQAEDDNAFRPFRRGAKGLAMLPSRMFLRVARKIERQPMRPRIKRRVERVVTRVTGSRFNFDAAIAGSGAGSFTFGGGFAQTGNPKSYSFGQGFQSGNAQPFTFGDLSQGAQPFSLGLGR